MATYREALDLFPAWANRVGLRHVEKLSPAMLSDFRTSLVSRPKSRARKSGRRGERREGKKARSAASVNKDLRSVRAFLNSLRKVGQLPMLDSDAIRDGLRATKEKRPVPRFLRADEVRSLIEAALRHDRQTFTMTRTEKIGARAHGSTARHPLIAPFLRTVLLTGCRRNEILGLTWAEVRLDEQSIELDAARVKTGHGRRVDLAVSPSLVDLLRALRLRAAGQERVFPHLTPGIVAAARKRLIERFGAPKFTWQELRRTCGTFLTCAPGIFGAASAFMSAKRLGHGVLVAEKHYLGALSGISAEASTLEVAMRIEEDAEAEQTVAARRVGE